MGYGQVIVESRDRDERKEENISMIRRDKREQRIYKLETKNCSYFQPCAVLVKHNHGKQKCLVE